MRIIKVIALWILIWLAGAVRRLVRDKEQEENELLRIVRLNSPTCVWSSPDVKFAAHYTQWRENPRDFERTVEVSVLQCARDLGINSSRIARHLQLPVDAVRNILRRKVLRRLADGCQLSSAARLPGSSFARLGAEVVEEFCELPQIDEDFLPFLPGRTLASLMGRSLDDAAVDLIGPDH